MEFVGVEVRGRGKRRAGGARKGPHTPARSGSAAHFLYAAISFS
jgi:hypothetical protein